ncbi:MAG: hypothetical protein KatS3mg110_0576 [Pirellulaceae bacterium]|nr:MAG: hypothetical protein KatS3mg110_0576 [Pirellulaceae bacterium]
MHVGHRFALWFAAGCALVAAGCNRGVRLAPVEGQITLDGQPVKDAVVTFTPVLPPKGLEAAASTGRTDEQGRYQLRLLSDNRTGAVVGQHNVTVTINVESESDVSTEEEIARQNAVPTNYFKFEVKPGSNKADFQLSRNPQPPQ